jgi:Protein of unknown function (DUF2786)
MSAGCNAGEVDVVGKASRQRRIKKEKERQRRREPQGHPQQGNSQGPQQGHPQHGHAEHGSAYQYVPPRETQPTLREVAAQSVREAVQAYARDMMPAFEKYVDMLSVHDDWPGWTEIVSRELVGSLRLAVTAAWRSGWQPAELVRHVGRETSEAHAEVAADMIADEMRAYAASTVDDRWTAQVAALGTQVWWGSDGDYTTRWCARYREDLQVLLRMTLQVLYVLQHLVRLPRLGPLPGTARPAAAPSAADQVDERMLGKIRALLAKAESTEFPEEAEALSARAQELMAKYSIDHALLAAETGRKDAPQSRRVPVDNPYESPKGSLLQAVAQANRCRTVSYNGLGMSEVIGFRSDLDAVEMLFTSLLVQANTAMLRAGAKKDQYGRSRTRAFRQSFLIAYAVRIGERLSEAAGHVEQEVQAQEPKRNLLPVLAARHQAVDDAVDEMFGDSLVSIRGSRVTDSEGWHSGRAAADLAALHGHRQVTGD